MASSVNLSRASFSPTCQRMYRPSIRRTVCFSKVDRTSCVVFPSEAVCVCLLVWGRNRLVIHDAPRGAQLMMVSPSPIISPSCDFRKELHVRSCSCIERCPRSCLLCRTCSSFQLLKDLGRIGFRFGTYPHGFSRAAGERTISLQVAPGSQARDSPNRWSVHFLNRVLWATAPPLQSAWQGIC